VRLGKDKKVEAMARVPLFAQLSSGELARLAKVADEIDLPKGKVLTREGRRAHEFFVLLEGTADVRRDTRLLPSLGPGDFLGEIALVTDSVRTATVTTTSPVRALVLTGGAFRTVMHDYPEIQRKVLEALAVRLSRSAL
jgi:CRP/FNR family transcriptional regulator, cyclic AMP receptor protein